MMDFVCKCGNTEEFSCIYDHYSETVDGEGNVLEADGNILFYKCTKCEAQIEPEEFQELYKVEVEEEGKTNYGPEA